MAMTEPRSSGLTTAEELAEAKTATDRLSEVLARATAQLEEILSDAKMGEFRE